MKFGTRVLMFFYILTYHSIVNRFLYFSSSFPAAWFFIDISTFSHKLHVMEA